MRVKRPSASRPTYSTIATHFVASVDGTQSDMGIYLLVGQAVPPIWLTKEDADEGMERTGGVVPIRLRGAFYMTRDKARDLHELLGNYLHANPESGD